MRRLLGGRRGVTLVELAVYGAVAAFIGLSASRLLRQPAELAKTATHASQVTKTDRSISQLVNDLRGAYGNTIQWTAIDPSAATYNAALNPSIMPWFQVHTDPGSAAGYAFVCYAYQPADRTVVRRYSTNAPVQMTQCLSGDPDGLVNETIVALDVVAPTASSPLFSVDPAALDTVVITFQFQPPAGLDPLYQPNSLVRRAHIRT